MRTKRVLGGVVAASLGLLIAWQAVRAIDVYHFEVSEYATSRHPVPMPPDSARLGLRDVSFPSRDGSVLRGWLVPSRNGAVVVLTHGSGSDRRDRLDDARALVAAGYGTLLFDFPGEGESAGTVTWGRTERAALEGAVDFALRQSGVDARRLGVIGFSFGGYITAQVAALDPRIRAVVLEAAPADLVEQTTAEYRSHGLAAEAGAVLALRLHGPDPSAMRAVDVVRAISPRPLLVVGGTRDQTVPPNEARQIYVAAAQPKELVIVPGATHGGYAEAVGGHFDSILVRFFDETLPAGSRRPTPSR